jgi:hypothetical protein
MELISSQPFDDFPINYFNPRDAEGKYGVQHNFRKGCFYLLADGSSPLYIPNERRFYL